MGGVNGLQSGLVRRVKRLKRKFCPNGHPWTEENIKWVGQSPRCILCNRAKAKKAYDKKKRVHAI